MPKEIVIKRSALLATMLAFAGIGVLLVVQQWPEIKREINMWMM